MGESRRKCLAVYTGRVQGVGFRMTALRLATNSSLGGHVRNLPDGRVELLVEGIRSTVDHFLQTLPLTISGHVDEVDLTEFAPDSEPLPPFEIRG